MANEGQNTNQQTSNSQSAGDAGEKLIFGKYKTLEEAEKGYKELEHKYHAGNERFSQFDARLQELETRRHPTEEVDDGYGRGQQFVIQQPQQQQQQNTEILTRFYADPQGTLQQIEERAVQRAEQRITERQRKAQNYQDRVANWAAQNPDVAAHGDLLSFYVQQTDARLAPETRLDQAAERVRKRVLEFKGSNQSQQKAEDFVDGAVSGHAGGGAPQQQQQQVARPEVTESTLKSYVAERNKHARKPLHSRGN